MTTPGFSAEASLGATNTHYRTSGSLDRPEGLIHLAQLGLLGVHANPVCLVQCLTGCPSLEPNCLTRCIQACGGWPWF